MSTILFSHCSVTIKRPTFAVSGGTYKAGEAETVLTGVPGLLQEKPGTLEIPATGQRLHYHACFYCEPGTDIQPKQDDHEADILVVERHPRIPAGTVFNVMHRLDRGGVDSTMAAHDQVLLSRA